MKIGIIANTTKDKGLAVTRQVAQKVSQTETVTVCREIADAFPHFSMGDGERLYKEQDMLLVLGGDGTLLRAARQAAPFSTPVLGINLGHVGFLSGAEKEDFLEGDVSEKLRQVRLQ